jgi:hypothetical protein
VTARYLPCVVLALALAPMAGLHAGESVFIGRASSQTDIDGVTACTGDVVCMTGWWRWTVDVERTVRGPAVPGPVVVARLGHGKFVPDYLARFVCFSVRPIEDEGKRRLLGADYVLVESWKRGDAHRDPACDR